MKKETAKDKDTYMEYRIGVARRAGACKNYTQEEFKRILLNIGLDRYMTHILPIENIDRRIEEELQSGAKIIPFPGVSFSMTHNARPENSITDFLNQLGYREKEETPDKFQNELDDFLREMGYIE